MVDVDFMALTLANRGVRVRGTAHYPVRLQMKTGVRGEAPVYVFPLFAPGDTTGRAIHVLVMTAEAPDPLLGFEDRTVEGLVSAPGNDVPQGLKTAFEEQGYRFADDYVLLRAVDKAPGS